VRLVRLPADRPMVAATPAAVVEPSSPEAEAQAHSAERPSLSEPEYIAVVILEGSDFVLVMIENLEAAHPTLVAHPGFDLAYPMIVKLVDRPT